MRPVRVLAPVLLLAGILLVVDAVARGSAHLQLVVIVPVVSGVSAEFLGGVLFLFLGFLLLPVSFLSVAEERLPDGRSPQSGGSASAGGVVVIGPLPIFFGTWKGLPPRYYWMAALAAVAAVVLLLFVVGWV